MSFPRARIRRFNELSDKTPGVGSYNLVGDQHGQFKELDRIKSLNKLDQSSKDLRDKGYMALAKGELPRHVEELHQRLKAAEEKAIDLEILKIGADKGRDMLQAECSSLQGEIKKLEGHIKELEVEKKGLVEQKQHLEKENIRNVKEKDKIVREQAALSSKLDLVCCDLTNAKEELLKSQTEVGVLKASKEKLEAEFLKIEAEWSEQLKQIDVFKAQLETLMASIGQEKDKSSNLERELGNLKQELEVMVQEKLQISDDLQQAELSQQVYKNDLCELQDKMSRLMESNQTILENIKHLESNKKELIDQRDGLLENIENLNKNFSELEERIAFADEAKRVCASEAEVLRQELDISKVSTADYKYLCEEKTIQIDNLTRQIKELEECVEELTAKVAHLESVNLLQEEQLVSVMKEIVGKNEQLSTIVENHVALEHQLQTELHLKTERIGFLESEIKVLETAISEKSDKLSAAEKEHETKIKDMQENIQRAQAEFTKSQNLCYMEKLAALEADRLAFENNLKQSFEEKVVQLETEQFKFQLQQEDKLKEAIDCIEREKTETAAKQQFNYDERLKVVEEEKQNFIDRQEKVFESKLKQLEADKANREKELEQEYLKKVQSLERAKAELNIKQQEMSAENRKLLDTEKEKIYNAQQELLNSELALHKAQQAQWYEDRKSLLEAEKLQLVAALELKYQEKENLLQRSNEAFLQNQKKRHDELVAKLDEEKKQFESAVEQSYKKQLQVLEEEKAALLKSLQAEFSKKIVELEHSKALLNQSVADFENQISSLEKEKLVLIEKRKSDRAKALMELQKLDQENRDRADRLKGLEEKCTSLSHENEMILACVQSKDKDLESLKREFARYKKLKEEELLDLIEAAEKNKDCLHNIISEMSDKIQSMEEEMTQLLMSQSENWKEKFEDLEKKLAPFKETLDAFELERKLLHDRDKYTCEQIDKLTKEAIKNMGHQNHRQRVKYVDNLKQENITLHKKLRDTQEELHRQNVLVKKYKENLEKLEGSKDHSFKTPLKPRIPLKEGNR